MDDVLAGMFYALIALGLILAGIAIGFTVNEMRIDRGECLEHKLVNTTQTVLAGKVPITQHIVQNRCVLWEFPEGRPE